MNKKKYINDSGSALAWAIIMFLIVITILACILPLGASSLINSHKINTKQQSYYTAKSVIDSIINDIQTGSSTEGTSGYQIYTEAKAAGADGVTWSVDGLSENMGEANVTIVCTEPYMYITVLATKGTEQTSLTATLYKSGTGSTVVTENTSFVSGPYGLIASSVAVLDEPIDESKSYVLALEGAYPFNILLYSAEEVDSDSTDQSGVVQYTDVSDSFQISDIDEDENRIVKSRGSIIYDSMLSAKDIQPMIAAQDIRLGSTKNQSVMCRSYEVTQYDTTVTDTDKHFYSIYAGGDIELHGNIYLGSYYESDRNRGMAISGGSVSFIGDGDSNSSYGLDADTFSLRSDTNRIQLEGYSLVEAANYISFDNVVMYGENRDYGFDKTLIKTEGRVDITNVYGPVVFGFKPENTHEKTGDIITSIYAGDISIASSSDGKGSISLNSNLYVFGANDVIIDDKQYRTTGTVNVNCSSAEDSIDITGDIVSTNLNVTADEGTVTINGDIVGENVFILANSGTVIVNGNIKSQALTLETTTDNACIIVNGEIYTNQFADNQFAGTLQYSFQIPEPDSQTVDTSYDIEPVEPYEYHEEYINSEFDMIESNDIYMPFDLVDRDGEYIFIKENIAGSLNLFTLDSDGVTFAKVLTPYDYPQTEVELTQIDESSATSVYYIDSSINKRLSLNNAEGNYYVVVRKGANLSLGGAVKNGTNSNLFIIVQEGATLNINANSECTVAIYAEDKATINLGDNCTINGSICGGKVYIGENVTLNYTELVGDVSVNVPLNSSDWRVLKYEENYIE